MLRFVELAQEVLPPGVLQVVTGDGVPVGGALVRHPAISLVSLTFDAVAGLTVGDPGTDDEIGMGPVISTEQRQRVLGFLERAVDAKATVLTGGEAVGERGYFVRPTLLADVQQDAEIVQSEVFGPVVTVQRFASDDEAVAAGTRATRASFLSAGFA